MKKTTLIIALIAISLINGFSQTVDLKRGLVAFYPFNGNANDESGNGNNGTVNGATLTNDRNGNSKSAYSFNGSYDMIDFNYSPTKNTDNFAIACWINPSITNQNGTPVLLGVDDCIGGKSYLNGVEIYIGSTGQVGNVLAIGVSDIEWIPSNYRINSANKWYFIVLQRNNTNYSMYVDGSQVLNKRGSSPRQPNDLKIGSATNGRFFNGSIDDVRIYDRALNEEEIQALYNNRTESLKPPTISWIAPSSSFNETSDLQYSIKANIKSEKQIKSIKVMSGYSTLANETYFYLSNGQGTFEKEISLSTGNNEITIVAENEDGSTTSTLKTIKYNEPQVPPLLSVSNINFTDNNNNNRIDGNEKCFINFTIANKGKGSARNLKVLVQNNSSISGLAFTNSSTLGTISPNSTQNVNIPISGTMDLTNGTANIKISFEESLGFPPDPFELNIETKEFVKPDVKVVDNSFLTDNGTIKLGIPIQLKVLIQNVGQGTAENVNVSFSYPSTNVFANGEKDFVIGTMQAGATKELIFEFIANKLYTEKQIPITIKISEKLGKFSQNKQVTATIDAKTSGNAITITSNANDNVVNIQVASLTADVDKNIPQNAIKYPNRYALIIGNEDYTSSQTGLSSEVNVAFATNDAKIFKEYAINTFGIEEKNCFLLINATAGQMSQKIELITQILSRLPDGELIFYYAGHGFPDETTKIPYLMPVDVSANNLQSAIKLTDIYAKFSQCKAKRITLFLDACFTGGGREQGLLAARGVKIKPKQETVSGNMVVFTATSEDQSALPYKERQHGIFTYFLLKKLQDSKGDINYSDLDKYVRENVSIESLKINGKAQDPKVNVSPDAQNTWETWKIK